MKSLKDVKTKLLAKPAVRQAYDAQAPEFELARELIAAPKYRVFWVTKGKPRINMRGIRFQVPRNTEYLGRKL